MTLPANTQARPRTQGLSRWLPTWFHRFGAPPYVYALAERLRPWAGALAILFLLIGLVWGLAFVPADYLQGDAFRIFYVHVPVAYFMTRIYVFMGISAAIGFVWRIKVAHAAVVSAAPIGASFAVLALVTGAIWGKPTWGTFWQWGDPRIMTALIQLFLYLSYMAIRAPFQDRDRADRVSAVLAVVGMVNAPIIYYSVDWWTSLHQGQTLMKLGAPSMPLVMLLPFLIAMAGFTLLFIWLFLTRLQAEIIEREHGARWLQRAIN